MSEELGQPLVNLCIVSLMGLPGSGKSTFCEKFPCIVKDIPNSGVVIVKYDDLVPLELQRSFPERKGSAKTARKQFVNAIQTLGAAIVGEKVLDDETIASTENIVSVQNLLDQTLKTLKAMENLENVFLVIDDNNYYQSMRNELYQVAKHLRCSFCVLFLDCPLDIAIERNSSRPENTKVPQSAVEEMSKKLEQPDPLSHPCDLFCLRIDTTTEVSEVVKLSFITLLGFALKNPLTPIEQQDRSEDRRICSENEVHQADLVLRKWVSKQYTVSSFTSHSSATARKQLSERLSKVKSTVLEKLRSGDLLISYRVDQDVEFNAEIVSLANDIDKMQTENCGQ